MSVKALRNQLLAAIAMVLVAALALGSSTFAWFAVNNEVSATSMRVTAHTEIGLLINEVSTANDSQWRNLATAAQTTTESAVSLYPASTADGKNWYHAASKLFDNSASATSGHASTDLVNGYETVQGGTENKTLTAITAMTVATPTAGTTAAHSTMGSAANAPAGYYVHYTYYLKGTQSGATGLGTSAGSMNVRIKSVTATQPGTKTSENLDKSLRVGIVMNNSANNFYIYAPVSEYTSSYFVNASSTATAPIAGDQPTTTDLESLPAVGGNGVPVDVYIWYEGEDANCKSSNAQASTLDDIAVDIVFDLYTIPTAGTGTGG